MVAALVLAGALACGDATATGGEDGAGGPGSGGFAGSGGTGGTGTGGTGNGGTGNGGTGNGGTGNGGTGTGGTGNGGTGNGGAGTGGTGNGGTGNGGTGGDAVGAVYAHSSDTLYSIDPATLQVRTVGAFGWPLGADQMTDIALDRGGAMTGISFSAVYSVDPFTARCTYLAPLDRSFNGLSFVPADEARPDGPELLVGAALDGSVYEIDPRTGASSQRGSYGGGLGSSGDLFFVKRLGTYATVGGMAGTDLLARVDTATGNATVVGDTGYAGIWGLAFWSDKVYGFTAAGDFLLIDVRTGRAEAIATGGVSFWGAGVTTVAPVIID